MRLAPLLLLLGLGLKASAGELGEAIYQRGEGAKIAEVQIGDSPAGAPLELFACQGCHGDDGRGLAEGGVVAPEIRWSYLSKPYAVRSGPFRLRPAYDEKLFARALREGIDSAGASVGVAMPRYRLDDAEIAGLLAYLRQLDQFDQTSPFGAEIPIGVRLPEGQGPEVRAALEAYFDSINRHGGIFERQIRLRFLEPGEPFSSGLAAGLDLAIPGSGVTPLPPADAVPVIALFPAAAEPEATRFTLYSGPQDRAAALLLFARRTLGLEATNIAILGEGRPRIASPRVVLYDGHDAAFLRQNLDSLPAGLILLLTGWLESPPLMDLARSHTGPVYVATPPTPHQGKAGLARLESEKRLPAGQRMVQLWALAAARALEAALEKAGRDLRPPELGGVLEGFSRLETGFGPDLRFSAARHLGARGSVVLRLGEDRASIADWQWIEVADE